MADSRNLLDQPKPTLLPQDHPDIDARNEYDNGADARHVAMKYPASSYAWAILARESLESGDPVGAYAFARTGYHRGLDALRRAGWRGQGLIPSNHLPNKGFLMALDALALAAQEIGEDEEAGRCRELLKDSGLDPSSDSFRDVLQ